MKLKKKFVRVLGIGSIISMLMCSSVFAGNDEVVTKDWVSNQFGAGYEVEMSGYMLDGCAAGYNVAVRNSEADGTVALAGYSVELSDTNIVGSFFGAGYDIGIQNSYINNNAILTGCKVSIDENVMMRNAIVAAEEIIFDGTTDYATFSAQTVVINGVINNDAQIVADTVIFGENAKIYGNLDLESKVNPGETENVVEGNVSFTEMIEEPEDSSAVNVAKKSIFAIIVKFILGKIYWIVAMLIIGLILMFTINDRIKEAKEVVVNNTINVIGFGFAALVGIPVSAIIIAITIEWLPTSALIMALYVIVLCLSQTFAGLVLGGLVFKDLIKNEKIASALGVIILIVLDSIPVIGNIISLASAVGTLGYLVICCKDIKNKKVEVMIEES